MQLPKTTKLIDLRQLLVGDLERLVDRYSGVAPEAAAAIACVSCSVSMGDEAALRPVLAEYLKKRGLQNNPPTFVN